MAIFIFTPFKLLSESGNIYYVSTTGNDNNPGTFNNPWKTIQKAMNTVEPNDIAYVRGGTYNGPCVMARSGASNGWITFKAYENETPIVNGGNPPDWGGGAIHFKGSYCILDGFKVTNAPQSGIGGRACSYIIIRNCYTQSTAYSGIRFDNGAHHIVVNGNTITQSNTASDQEALTFENSCHDLEIIQNKIFNVAKEGIDLKVGCFNAIVAYNDVDSEDPDIYFDSYGVYQHDFQVYGNYCHGSGSAIVIGFEQTNCAYQANFNIYNNILKSNSWGFDMIWESSGCSNAYAENVKIINNNFDGGMGIRIHNNKPWKNVIIRNNIFSVGTIKNINSVHQVTWDNNFESGDPKWVNPSAGDYHLQSGSPCIDKGSSNNAPSIDFEGDPRPQGNGYDIGADEYKVDVPTPPPGEPNININFASWLIVGILSVFTVVAAVIFKLWHYPPNSLIKKPIYIFVYDGLRSNNSSDLLIKSGFTKP